MSAKSGLVGIMVANRGKREFALKKHLRYNAPHVKLVSFTPADIDWSRRRITGLHRMSGKLALGSFPFPQVVYNRCYTTDRSLIKRLETAIGKNKIFNQINQFNKLETYQKISEWLVHHLPETVPYDQENAARLLAAHKVVYFKPCRGLNGKGVYRAETKQSGEIHISQHHVEPELIAPDALQFHEMMQRKIGQTSYIVQAGIEPRMCDDQHFDIRVLAQKKRSGSWSVTNVVSRLAHKGCFNTSMCAKVVESEHVLRRMYPPEKVKTIMRSVYDISLRSAEIMEIHAGYHLGEVSVDSVLDNDGHLWIIEVNGKPQKDLYDGLRNRNAVYQRPMQYARYLCRR